MTEFQRKEAQIRAFMERNGVEALLLQRVSSFAWATCGAASYVNRAAAMGAASLLLTPDGRFLIADNIEATRLEQEEKLKLQGWEFKIGYWYEANQAVAELSRGLALGADSAYPGAKNLAAELSRERANLTPEEGDKFRELGQICAAAMDEAVHAVQPGQTEYEIAAILAQSAEKRGAQAIVNLIATDERIFKFRHPLPTGKKLEKYAMLVLCGRRSGLVVSITRLVHFGPLPDELKRKETAVAQIDAELIAATRPGAVLRDVFEKGTAVYAQTGYPDEWQLHHQGGPAGFEPREQIATLTSAGVVAAGQAYAWNPSITGIKSEDSILVGEDENDIVTAVPDWPILPVAVDDQTILRPKILEIL
jgi:antitoxin VapB